MVHLLFKDFVLWDTRQNHPIFETIPAEHYPVIFFRSRIGFAEFAFHFLPPILSLPRHPFLRRFLLSCLNTIVFCVIFTV